LGQELRLGLGCLVGVPQPPEKDSLSPLAKGHKIKVICIYLQNRVARAGAATMPRT